MVVHHWSDDGMVMYHRRSLFGVLGVLFGILGVLVGVHGVFFVFLFSE